MVVAMMRSPIILAITVVVACNTEEREPFSHEVTSNGGGPASLFEIRVAGTAEVFQSHEPFTLRRDYEQFEEGRVYVITLEVWEAGELRSRNDAREGGCRDYCEDGAGCDPAKISLQGHRVVIFGSTIVLDGQYCLVDGLS